MTFKVHVDHDLCIGAGQCVLVAPQIFDQDDKGLVILLDPIFQGLAVALISGVVVATALTLVVIPLLYYMYLKFKIRREMEHAVPEDSELAVDLPVPTRREAADLERREHDH